MPRSARQASCQRFSLMEMIMVLLLPRGCRAGKPKRHCTCHHALLLSLILTMVLLGVLGATLASLLSSSQSTSLTSYDEARAYYLAESAKHGVESGVLANSDAIYYIAGGSFEIRRDAPDSNTGTAIGRIIPAVGSLAAQQLLAYRRSVTENVIVAEKVFVLGTTIGGMTGGSSTMQGDDATVVLDQDLILGGSTEMSISNIFTEADIRLGGSSKIGSSTNPGIICIAGDLYLGVSSNNHIYGDVYVGGDFHPGQATIFGNVYVRGDVRLDTHSGQPPTMVPVTNRIYYAGSLYTGSQTSRIQFASVYCVHDPDVSICNMPSFPRPKLRSTEWYDLRGYASSGALSSNARIFSQGNYSSGSGRPTATNVIVVSTGNITITMNLGGDVRCTGILFAPYGSVSFSGAHFEGLVIARDGFNVERQNATIIFKNLEEFIADPDDYPFE